MSKVQLLPDDTLMRLAGNAARNLTVVAILITILAVAAAIFSGLAILSEPTPFLYLLSAVPLLIAAAGCWMLVVAAKRGNATSVTIVIGVLSLQVLLSVAGYCLGMVRSADVSPASLVGAVVAVLVAAVFGS